METNLCVAGFGGQGVMTLGKFLASATCPPNPETNLCVAGFGGQVADARISGSL